MDASGKPCFFFSCFFVLFLLPASTKSHSTRKQCVLKTRTPLYFFCYFLPVLYFFCYFLPVLYLFFYFWYAALLEYQNQLLLMSMVLAGSTGSHYYPNTQHLEHTFLNKLNIPFSLVMGSPKTDKSMGEIAATKAEGKVKASQKQTEQNGGNQKIKRCKGSILGANHDVERAPICNLEGYREGDGC
jgi:hypothetical protein